MRIIWRPVKHPRIDLRSGEVVVIAPRGTDVEALIESKRKWIDAHLSKIKKIKDEVQRDIKTHGVRILDVPRKVVLRCEKPVLTATEVHVCPTLKKELKALLREDLQGRVDQYAGALGVKPEKIYLRMQSTKWGSCSSRRNISFNLSLIFTPEVFRDYVVAHEIVHLRHANHGREFWNTLSRLNVQKPERDKEMYYWYYAQESMKILRINEKN
ncbi:MAG: M48 family metallopeptidase [Euryarchaeota archaeon]|nr:M48 family metallopeptidase [Euryarchaeota archaeon]